MRNAAILSNNVRTYPQLLATAGYYCTNPGKTDYQGLGGANLWNGTTPDYRTRPDKTKPFMHVVNFDLSHEQYNTETDTGTYNTATVTLPPYYPNTAKTRRVWATYLNNITQMDTWVKARLDELTASGEAANTIVFIYSDHGAGLPRAKRWLFDSGLRIPFLLLIPAPFRRPGLDMPGTSTNEVVSTVDLAPTLLNLAGAAIPAYMQGRAFLGPNLSPQRTYNFAARDRMDERYDIIRSAHDTRYSYIHNFEYFKPRLQYNEYAEINTWSGITQEIRRVGATATPPANVSWYFEYKPVEELYDTQTDPHQMNNLACLPQYQAKLVELRTAQAAWRRSTRDMGSVPEGMLLARRAAYGSEYDLARLVPGSLDSAWAVLDSLPYKSASEFITLMGRGDDAIRYWAATGLGNLMDASAATRSSLTAALTDVSPWVRIAAARGLLFLGTSTASIGVLRQEMLSANDIVRLAAILVCDEMGTRASGLTAEITALNTDPDQYVSRVAIRALATINDAPELPPAVSTNLCAVTEISRPIGIRNSDTRITENRNSLLLQFSSPEIYRVEIRSPSGKLVWNGISTGREQMIIPKSGIPSGIYFLNTQSGSKKNSQILRIKAE